MNSLELLKQFLKSMIYAHTHTHTKKKNYFNNNLVMALEDERGLQSSNRCWICDKLFNVGNNKVRDHCHINSKET